MTSLSQLIRINCIKAFRRRTQGVTEVCDCLQLYLVSLTSLKSNENPQKFVPILLSSLPGAKLHTLMPGS